MTTMTFTPTEALILAHRIEVWDAIADAFASDGKGYKLDQIVDRCDELLRGWHEGQSLTVDMGDVLTRDIIEDACHGSTVFADLDDQVLFGEISRGKALALIKAAKSLIKKLGVSQCGDIVL